MCDLQVAFTSMFLLAFGLSAFGLGLFTAYFGAGKSRMIGVILTLIGLVVLLIFYFMTIDYFGYGWQSEDVKDSFLAVLGIAIGGIVSFALVIILMMIIKEPEPEIPGIEEWEKELAAMDSDKPEDEKEPKEEGEGTEEKGPDEEIPESQDEVEKEPEDENEPGDEEKDNLPEPEEPEGEEPTDDMTTFLKDKEENKIVKEEWEKVDEDGNVEGPGEPEIPSEPPGEEPEAPDEPQDEGETEPLPPVDEDELPENPEEPEKDLKDPDQEPGEDAMDEGTEKKEGD